MSEGMIVSLGRDAVLMVLTVAGPMLLAGLVVGLLVSLLQATTQIQEQTLVFIPKIIAVLVTAVVFGPWMLRKMIEFSSRIIGEMPQWIQ